MPEEINRIVTDQLSDLLFTPSDDANANLQREGIALEKIHLVGNAMIDTLVSMLPVAKSATAAVLGSYVLVTLHRPGNVDDLDWLKRMVDALREISTRLPVLFPIHPRTRKRLEEIGIATHESDAFRFLQPLPYLEFLALQSRATLVITDSGGIQEESTFLGVPCLTVRDNTERPITVTHGTNVLVGRDSCRLIKEVDKVLAGTWKKSTAIPFWDGKTGDRIAEVICHEHLKRTQQNREIAVSCR
jgi:UDP-N-acetylglucosamine 2-epimerase (non-hydrolysing)